MELEYGDYAATLFFVYALLEVLLDGMDETRPVEACKLVFFPTLDSGRKYCKYDTTRLPRYPD